jgi:hypothetical protein
VQNNEHEQWDLATVNHKLQIKMERATDAVLDRQAEVNNGPVCVPRTCARDAAGGHRAGGSHRPGEGHLAGLVGLPGTAFPAEGAWRGCILSAHSGVLIGSQPHSAPRAATERVGGRASRPGRHPGDNLDANARLALTITAASAAPRGTTCSARSAASPTPAASIPCLDYLLSIKSGFGGSLSIQPDAIELTLNSSGIRQGDWLKGLSVPRVGVNLSASIYIEGAVAVGINSVFDVLSGGGAAARSRAIWRTVWHARATTSSSTTPGGSGRGPNCSSSTGRSSLTCSRFRAVCRPWRPSLGTLSA